MDVIRIYTDGSSLGNPGPGGYGIVLKWREKVKKISKGFKLTTNNRMELMAVIESLKSLSPHAKEMKIVVYTDSKYVVDAVTKGWVYGWQKKNFKDKKNPDLWRAFLRISKDFDLSFEWVKGHSGHEENEICDKLAKTAAEGKNLEVDSGYEKLNKSDATLL